MTEIRRPIHLVVLMGASAGIYAVSLAGVTLLQSSADLALTEDRQPLDAATNELAVGHDALGSDLAGAGRAYSDAAASYDRLAPRLADTETTLDALAATVARIDGAAKALPGRVALPKVTRGVAPAKAPVTHATTGASGG